MLERTDSWSRLSAGPSTLTDMLVQIYLQGTERGWPTLSQVQNQLELYQVITQQEIGYRS